MKDWQRAIREVEAELARIDDEDQIDVEMTLANILRVQQDLEHSESRYRLFIEESTMGIWHASMLEPASIHLPTHKQVDAILRHAVIDDCNDAMARDYGFDQGSELRGKHVVLLMGDTEHTREYLSFFINNRYRLKNAETLEHDRQGNPKVFMNTLIGRIVNEHLVGGWGVQRDVSKHRFAPQFPDIERDVKSLLDQLNQIAICAASSPNVLHPIREAVRSLNRILENAGEVRDACDVPTRR